MAESFSPIVYWGQNSDTVFLKVDIREVLDPKIHIDEDEVDFKCIGLGLQGRHEYKFKICFYLPIEAKQSKYRIGERCIEIQLRKVGIGECWPRLTYEQKKPGWLKIDFDHFAYEDETDEEMQKEAQEKAEEKLAMDRLENELKEVEQSAFADIKTFYLFVYNLFMWVGFSSVFCILSFRYLRFGEESKAEVWTAVGPQLMVTQLAAVIEILHPLFGLVKTSPLMPLMQVFGRNLVLFSLIASESRLQNREVVWWLFLVWSAVELVRYPYYMLNLVNMEWKVVTWLRYTIWIPLYPLGFVLEGFVMLLAVPLFEQTGRWSLTLPNSLNVSFHFPAFLRVYMFLFLFGMYFLMKRMYEQRKKKIPPGVGKRRTTKRKTKAKTS